MFLSNIMKKHTKCHFHVPLPLQSIIIYVHFNPQFPVLFSLPLPSVITEFFCAPALSQPFFLCYPSLSMLVHSNCQIPQSFFFHFSSLIALWHSRLLILISNSLTQPSSLAADDLLPCPHWCPTTPTHSLNSSLSLPLSLSLSLFLSIPDHQGRAEPIWV